MRKAKLHLFDYVELQSNTAKRTINIIKVSIASFTTRYFDSACEKSSLNQFEKICCQCKTCKGT